MQLFKDATQKHRRGFMTPLPREPKPGIFYLLSQIHKPDNPGLPIFSGISTIKVGVSGYADCILFPYDTGAASYLKDTDSLKAPLTSFQQTLYQLPWISHVYTDPPIRTDQNPYGILSLTMTMFCFHCTSSFILT